VNHGARTLLREDRGASDDSAAPALPLTGMAEPLVDRGQPSRPEAVPLEPARALVLTDFQPPRAGPVDSLVRWAYRLGVPNSVLAAPLRKPAAPRLLATVASPLQGERAAGMALRAGQFLVHGLKVPVDKLDFASNAPLTPPVQRAVQGFGWLRDLGACAPREECAAIGEKLLARWLKANPVPAKGPAWTVEHAGLRLLAWLVHAPLLLGGDARLRARALGAMEATARFLDRQVAGAEDRLGQVAGWCALVAAGLLLPDGRPRRLFGEAGLLRALGELVSEDGGVLSRSPLAQGEAIALLVDLRACYAAVDREPPPALETMLGLLVPPLLTLRMGDRGLGSWQGAGATSAARVDALIAASGVRARPGKESRHWGYQRVDAGKATLVLDAAPPPRARHARYGCASTLAFELSHGEQRIIVNCGGGELAGGLVPVRIEQGLRGSAAHSTLVVDDVNSAEVLGDGAPGRGPARVTADRQEQDGDQLIDASHDGYAERLMLTHRRRLFLSADGADVRGEDVLTGSGGEHFAVRFHLHPKVKASVSQNGAFVLLRLPGGQGWRMLASGGTLALADSVYLGQRGEMKRSQQIIVSGTLSGNGTVMKWALRREEKRAPDKVQAGKV